MFKRYATLQEVFDAMPNESTSLLFQAYSRNMFFWDTEGNFYLDSLTEFHELRVQFGCDELFNQMD